MSLSKKLFAGVLLAGSLRAAAAPATAALSEVPTGMVGIFKDADYVGLLGYRGGGQGLKNLSTVANDEMSSWTNKISYTGAWYVHENAGGGCFQMNSWTNNRYVGFAYNDIMSSWRTNGGC